MRLLKQAREEAGLSQETLGRRLKRPQSYLGKIETYQRRLDALELFDLLEAMNLDPGSFADRAAVEIGKRGRSKRGDE